MTSPKTLTIGCIADDFTGASDIALTLREGGLSVVQYGGTPSGAAGGEQAAVIALKSRSCAVELAIAQSLDAARWLRTNGAQLIVFKVCSTFDSTADGNIGPVAAALAAELGEDLILTCPAFPENGRTVYMGHLFVKDVLLNESGMQNHPLTPMTDPDLRRHLARQTDWAVTHLPLNTLRGDGAAAALATMGRAMVIVDAIDAPDLMMIGELAKARKLVTGGSGIAMGLPAAFGLAGSAPAWRGVSGRGVVLSGSCSTATRGQVARYRAIAPHLELTAEHVMNGKHSAKSLADWVETQYGAQDVAPMIFSSADPAVVAAAQRIYGTDKVAGAIEALFAQTARELAKRGYGRIVVAGGETSGAVATGVGAQALEIGPRIAAGVPSVRVIGETPGDKPLALALKSGNFGLENFFEDALRVLAGA